MRGACPILTAVLASLCLAAPAAPDKAPSRTHVRLGGVSVAGGYASGPFLPPYLWYSQWPYGWGAWDAWDWYAPFYHPGYFTGFARGPSMGEIKLRTAARDAEVYLDGAYAGRASDLKTIWLEPGAYDLEVKAGNASFERRVYVLSGKTLKIDASVSAAEERKR